MAQWSNEVFASNLRKYMERSGKNQKDLAEVVGVSSATFSEWINAKKYPRIDKIEILSDYFGILKSDLIEDKQEKPTVQDDGLTDDMRELIECVKRLPEDKRQVLLQVARSIQ